VHWQRTTHGPFEAWEGLSENLRAVVLPALGSRMVSLVHVPSGREWLEPGHGPADPGYGAPFPEGGLCGWDEMFPSIDPCRYPEDPWRGAEIPDHGEVWSIPWQAELRDGALHLRTHGVRFPYRLEKRLSFDGDGALLIHYRAENLSPFPFRFAWTAHPLFRVNPGTRIELPLPEGARYVITAAGPDRPAGGQAADEPLIWPFPGAGDALARLDVAPGRNARCYTKVWFLDPLREGWARLSDPVAGQALTFEFPPDRVPHFALWLNYGGYQNGWHVAPEPSTAFGDGLADAIRENRAASLPPFGAAEWHLRVRIHGIGDT